MYLDSMIKGLDYKKIHGGLHILVTNLVYDSRKVHENDVFVCISGAVSDGHDYIEDAIEKGAKAIVMQKSLEESKIASLQDITIIQVDSTRKALGIMAANYFGNPAEKITTIGITGTKGKTTTAYMIKEILEAAGKKTGLIGTIETIIGDDKIPANNTTPESYTLQETLMKMVESGCDTVVMEVSSQGLMLERVSGFTFDYGIFTNLSPDHIGEHEHKDFEDYRYNKSKLFKQCKVGLINIDDENADKILRDSSCKIVSYGFSEESDFRARNIELYKEKGLLGVKYKIEGLINSDVKVDVPGKFSVYNSLSAIALCYHFNMEADKIVKAIDGVKVKGRIEILPVSDKFTVMIDYAHNAMSLESLLETLKQYNPKRLITLFGCGGNRARDRRFEMGEVSSNLSDLTIITSDNPRFEEPQRIIDDIIVGMKKGQGKYIEIIDRKEAIKYAIENALEGDIIVLAGKGHEEYQEIKGVKYPMDERLIVKELK